MSKITGYNGLLFLIKNTVQRLYSGVHVQVFYALPGIILDVLS